MPAACVRTVRAASSQELDELRVRAKGWGTPGCATIIALPLVVTGFLVGLQPGGFVGGVTGALLAAAALGCCFYSFHRFSSPVKKRMRQDLSNAQVEVLAIVDAVPLSIPASHSSADPGFAFELENGRTLLLLGEWLCEPDTFGGDWKGLPDNDEGDNFANALPPPFSFPTRAFTVHRFPLSGEVLRISLESDYVAPETMEGDIDLAALNDMPSRVLHCPLSDLAETVRSLRSSS
jgi:hypothetical protein